MLIAILVIIGLSILIISHELGHFLAAKWFGLKVDEFGFGFPPRIFARKKGETEYSLNWLPFGGFVRIAGENDRINGDLSQMSEMTPEEKKRIFLFQPAWKRSVIILAGVAVNFVIGWILISTIFMIGTPRALVITDVQKDSPAAAVGILSGDVVDGYLESKPFIEFVNQNKGKEIDLTVKRGEELVTIKVTPRAETLPDQGALGVVLAEAGSPKLGFFQAIGTALYKTYELGVLTIQSFVKLIVGLFTSGKLIEGVVGPVGIFGVASKAGQLGIIYVFQLISLISINLAVINLLPFPALDGGRFFLILIEKIKGSPIPLKVEAVLNGAGFVFLILLMVIITIRDVTGWWF